MAFLFKNWRRKTPSSQRVETQVLGPLRVQREVICAVNIKCLGCNHFHHILIRVVLQLLVRTKFILCVLGLVVRICCFLLLGKLFWGDIWYHKWELRLIRDLEHLESLD